MMEFYQAKKRANEIARIFKPYCSRVEVAGSIRRRAPEVKDIELVVIPNLTTVNDLLGYKHKVYDPLEYPVIELKTMGGIVLKSGARYKQIDFPEGIRIGVGSKPFYPGEIKLDLFVVIPPAQFGVIFAIRTGPADYSRLLVTDRQHGGYLPSYLKVKNGALMTKSTKWNGEQTIETPEERDFYKAIDLEYIQPQKRYNVPSEAEHG